MIADPNRVPDRSWREKFQDAFRGVWWGVRGQKSFYIHFFFTAAVVVAGCIFQVDRTEWCLLILCIAGVLTAEMFNSALEWLIRSLPEGGHPQLGSALDIGSAAVLIASIGSVIIGLLVFMPHLLKLFSSG